MRSLTIMKYYYTIARTAYVKAKNEIGRTRGANLGEPACERGQQEAARSQDASTKGRRGDGSQEGGIRGREGGRERGGSDLNRCQMQERGSTPPSRRHPRLAPPPHLSYLATSAAANRATFVAFLHNVALRVPFNSPIMKHRPITNFETPFLLGSQVRIDTDHGITDREQFVIANFNGRQIAPSHDTLSLSLSFGY